MNAIVYTSNAGHTERYAKLLEKLTGIPAYSSSEAAGRVQAGSEILYMGWVMAGNVKGLSRAARRYRVKAVCAVGMGAPGDGQEADLIKRSHMEQADFFYLQGGYDAGLLNGIYGFMMKTMSRLISSSIEKKETKTAEDTATLEMIRNGKDCVTEANLAPVAAWCNAHKM